MGPGHCDHYATETQEETRTNLSLTDRTLTVTVICGRPAEPGIVRRRLNQARWARRLRSQPRRSWFTARRPARL